MKNQALLIFVALFLGLSGCKYDSVAKVVKASKIKLVLGEGESKDIKCFSEQLNFWNLELATGKRKWRTELVKFLKNRVSNIVVLNDLDARTTRGRMVRVSLQEGWDYYGQPILTETLYTYSDVKSTGPNPVLLVSLKDRTLSLQSSRGVNDYTIERYIAYSRFLNIRSLADVERLLASRDRDAYLAYGPMGFQSKPQKYHCPKVISLEYLQKIISRN